MKINENISMNEIYEKVNNNIFSFDDFEISMFTEDIFSIKYKNKKILDFILKKPMKIKYKDSNLSLINTEHLREIIKKYDIIEPIISCNSCKENFSFSSQVFGIHENHDLSLVESIDLERLSNIEFNNLFNKEKENNVLGKKFKNPEEFEPNFEHYFPDYEIYKNNPFTLFTDNKRNKFIYDLINDMHLLPKKIRAYFGQSGIGKSTLIITASKYKLNHDQYGTLYINLKCLNYLIKNQYYKLFRRIFVDEVAYLFKGNYDNYINCTNIIHRFQIEYEDSVWYLINEIINFILRISNKKKYIFIFDQYNSKKDPNNWIIKIFNEFIINKSENNDIEIGLFTFSSMNNSDIKDYKINLIKNIYDFNFKKDIRNIKNFIELYDIFDSKKFKFDDEEYEELYELLGRNIKYYNILNYHFYNQKSFEKSYDEIKQHIKDKIKKYYNCEDNEKNIMQLIYFSTKAKYNLDGFLDIANYIPFKYFIPIIKKDKKNKANYIEIEFAYPLIEEIVNELLDENIYSELNFYKTLISGKKVDDGARDYMFKKYITYLLNANSSDRKKLIFKDIIITKKITLQKFIPKPKDKPIKEKNKKTKLEEGIYLFTQKIINGNLLDILIIFIDKNNKASIIAIQITIHKPKIDIFDSTDLIICLDTLYMNIKKLYDFDLNPESMFFTYIFDKSYEKVSKSEFNEMIKKCDSNNIAYILFNPDDDNFYNKEGKKIKFLKDEVKGRNNLKFKKHIIDDDEIENVLVKFFPKNYVLRSCYLINYEEIQIAISIIKNDFENGYNIKKLYFNETTFIKKEGDFKKESIYFGRTEKRKKCYIIYYSLNSKKFISRFLIDDKYNEEEIEYLNKNADVVRMQILDEYKIEYEI